MYGSSDSSIIVYLIFSIIERVIFGLITAKINSSKGRDGGFAWGFFLCGIGIIVTATRSSLIEETSSEKPVNYFISEKKEEKPAEPPKLITWKCAKCGRENLLSCNFCEECGERRHYQWKCASCGKENAPEVKFCPECGGQRSDEQEMTPELIAPDTDFISYIKTLGSAEEIASAFELKYGGVNNENAREMITLLEKSVKMERSYGNMKDHAVKKLEAFFNSGMQFYTVNRTEPTLTCPVCGKVQRSDRDACFSCGALFKS